ncbi:MAG: hypothetical protein LBO09_04660 [Candidatus Peribacteria bacterium]|jgi:hypothetical protein|nr:hypothetical protein [Candidatus Peribacteria bacterium]
MKTKEITQEILGKSWCWWDIYRALYLDITKEGNITPMEIYLDQENYDKVQSEFERKLLKEPKKNYPKYINKAINYKQKYRNHDTTNAQHYSAKD